MKRKFLVLIPMKPMNQIDYEYYEWLISQIHIPNGKSYNDLFEIMHNIEFHWTVPNDNNRLQDGKDLRYEFLNDRNLTLNLGGVTVLEILISLSRRTAFTAGGTPEDWAWKLLKNLQLTKKPDRLTEEEIVEVNDILDALIWRTYERDGRGGFFPLKNSEEDQTKVEIWYQMNQYVIERKYL
jgi:hypothetical protein